MKRLVWLPLAVAILTSPLCAGPTVNAVVNGASFKQGPVSPGTIISIFGTGLARNIAGASSLPLPITLDGTSVTINAQPIPLFFVSPNQINAQVPFLVPAGPAQVSVRDSTGATGSLGITIARTSPGIFSTTSDGKGQAAALHADFKPVRKAVLEYALIGETIVVFCTGLGAVQGFNSAGFASPGSPPAVTVGTPTVLMDGRPVQVTFSGLAPGFAGLYQINFVVPQGVGGDVVTTIRMGDTSSNEVTINVAGIYLLAASYSGRLVSASGTLQLELNSVTSVSSTRFKGAYRVLAQGLLVDAGSFEVQATTTVFLLTGIDSTGAKFAGAMDTLDAGRSFFGCIVDDPQKPTACVGTFEVSMRVPTLPLPPPPVLPGISTSCLLLEGAFIFGSNGISYGVFLGRITFNIFAGDSIGNPYGLYGSQFSPTSIFNPYGSYGSQFSALSAFNQFATSPPIVFVNGQPVAFLTVNPFKTPRIDPVAIFPCVGRR